MLPTQDDALVAMEVTPPGMEHVVKALKDKPGIDNPWAIAWAQYNRQKEIAPPGYEHVVEALKGRPGLDPHAVAWAMHVRKYECEGKSPDSLLARLRYEASREAREANSLSGLGFLARAGVQVPGHGCPTGHCECFKTAGVREAETCPGGQCLVPFREATGVGGGSATAPSAAVVLMTEGAGNSVQRNYYPREALARSYRTFEGVKCFINHPKFSEESDRPERDARDVCGWFSNVALQELDGLMAIVGRLNFMTDSTGREAQAMVRDTLRYQETYPGRVLLGFSINASGPSHPEMRGGMQYTMVDGIDQVVSTDLVTFPARGGRVLSMRESAAWRRRYAIELRLGWAEALNDLLEATA